MRHMLTVACLLILLSGCASSRTDLIKSGFLTVQSNSPSESPSVYEQDGALVVDGRVSATEVSNGGRVNVQVIARDGAMVYEAVANCHKPMTQTPNGPKGIERGSQTSLSGYATYSVRFPRLPPAGSVVCVKYDPQPRSTEGAN